MLELITKRAAEPTMTERAKSRLSVTTTEQLVGKKSRAFKKSEGTGHPLILKYLRHLPVLLGACVFLGLLGYFVSSYHPSHQLFQVGPIPYLLVVVLFFLGSFFLATFVMLNKRRGLLLASALSWLLFLKLQHVSLGFVEVILALAIVGTCEGLLLVLKRLSA